MVGAALCWGNLAQAQSCDTTYVTQEGDTLTTLADRFYGEAGQWSLIYYANITGFTGGPTNIAAGTNLYIPCVEGQAKPDPAPLQQTGAELRFLTGALPPLLTDPNGTGGGMVTEIINAVMEETPNPVPYAVDWNPDWAAHGPALSAMQADMGFPWVKPDCEGNPSDARCTSYHWSDPVFVLPIQLFVLQGSGMGFASDADLAGKTLCLPEGAEAAYLDANGRNWLKDGTITVTRAADMAECFGALVEGRVDAVPDDIFSGAKRVIDMGLKGRVLPLERPVGTQSLHVVIAKAHWRGTTHLYRVNAGLAAIRGAGRYDEIVNRHLGLYMESLKR
ncbi:transporter substrate-binding domain-containing protein [Gemmobacter denitrificans]|uniref:Transporter substrate-binding domain-containing protein n=1 Tax=Gemmobacter denitrificans TaxID=3123040 RepID=A0ABU8BQ07_9RHOB